MGVKLPRTLSGEPIQAAWELAVGCSYGDVPCSFIATVGCECNASSSACFPAHRIGRGARWGTGPPRTTAGTGDRSWALVRGLVVSLCGERRDPAIDRAVDVGGVNWKLPLKRNDYRHRDSLYNLGCLHTEPSDPLKHEEL